MSSLEREVRGF